MSEAKERIGVALLHAAKRLVAWSVQSGNVYQVSLTTHSIVKVTDDGVNLTEVSDLASVSAGEWFMDRDASILYVELSDSSDPELSFMGVEFRLHFATVGGISLPHDMASGFETEYVNLLSDRSQGTVSLDTRDFLGEALEGNGLLVFDNDLSYWSAKFEKLGFENQRVFLYRLSTRATTAANADLIFKGRVKSKIYTSKSVSFRCIDIIKELRAPVATTLMDAFSYDDFQGLTHTTPNIPDGLRKAFRREVYGVVAGFRPLNIDRQIPSIGRQIFGASLELTNNDETVTDLNAFTNLLRIDDQVTFPDLLDGTFFGIDSFTAPTFASMELSEVFNGATGSSVCKVFMDRPDQRINRVFKCASHVLAQPATTVTAMHGPTVMEVADASDFRVNDQIEVTSLARTISSINGNFITLSQAITVLPPVASAVLASSIWDVFLNDQKLALFTDYTYDPDLAELRLTGNAELFHTSPKILDGTLAYTSGNTQVVGTGTRFQDQLRPGDAILNPDNNAVFQVWFIESDTVLQTTGLAPTTSSGNTVSYKNVEFYQEGRDILTCTIRGKTTNGVKTGTFPQRASAVCKQLFVDAGLTTTIDGSSFDDAEDEIDHRVGLAIPDDFNATESPNYRESLSEITRSVLATITYDADFKYRFKEISPLRSPSAVVFRQHDIRGFSIKAENTKSVKTILLRYRPKEADAQTGESGFSEESFTSDRSQYLLDSSEERIVKTKLYETASATAFAGRWMFITEFPTAMLSFMTSADQAVALRVGDAIRVEHPQIYESFGGFVGVKYGIMTKVVHRPTETQIQIDDLGNAFVRAGVITENSAADFDVATSRARETDSYITENTGIMEEDQNTEGLNLIW